MGKSASSTASRNHHWWPVGLQTYWTNSSGDLSWVRPDGEVGSKKAANRKIARKAHGHTILFNGPWTTNFESDFEAADDSVHDILRSMKQYKPKGGRSLGDFLKLMSLIFKRDRQLHDLCSYYTIDDRRSASLGRMIVSLLIRLPARRHAYEAPSKWMGLPADPNVGKANMRQFYHIACDALVRGNATSLFFVLIHSPHKEFHYGDGVLDWLCDSLMGLTIRGRALLPLTPNLCIYVSTPSLRYGAENYASFYAANWLVDSINEMTQIYSKDYIFFRRKRPTLSEHFRRGEFMSHSVHRDETIDLLDTIVSRGRPDSLGQLFSDYRGTI